tara:strand:+ start:2510 stop:3451 length:942 start_codon:yes stop_codon:yes gene_type:complete
MKKVKKLDRLDSDFLDHMHVIWYITGNCKFNCAYCDVMDNKRVNTHLDSQKKIADTLFKLKKGFEIYLYGGEPTEYKYFHELVQYINSKESEHFKGIELQTNLNISLKELKRILEYDIKISPSIHLTFLKGDSLEGLIEKIILIQKSGKLNRIDFMLEKWTVKKHVQFNQMLVDNNLTDYIQYIYNYFEQHTGEDYTGKWNSNKIKEYEEIVSKATTPQETYRLTYDDDSVEELCVNEMIVKDLSFKGRTCEARKYLTWIDYNGNWWECNIAQAKGTPLGNILRNPNHFLVTTQFPVKCRFEKCDACFFVKRY